MAKLISKGNLSVFEYEPGAIDPEFQMDDGGVLFIFGYHIYMGETRIGVAKQFHTGLKNYQVVGRYESAKEKIQGDFSEMLNNLDIENCVFLISTLPHPPQSIINQQK